MKIVCIGDSITYGFPYGPDYSWVHLVSTAVGANMINEGQNGDTTYFMYYRFKRDVLSHKPDYVIMMGGTNDASVGEPVEKVAKNIEMMVQMAKDNNIEPVIALPIPAGDDFLEKYLALYREWMRQFAKKLNIPVIDFEHVMKDHNSGNINKRYYIDDVHPSIDGYDAMAGEVETFIKEYLNLNKQGC